MASQRRSSSAVTTSSSLRRESRGAAHGAPDARRRAEAPDWTSNAARVAALVFLLTAVVFLETPRGQEFFHVLQKLGHSVTFGIVALLVLSFLRSRRRSLLADCGIAMGVTVALGALTEVAQIYSHRDPSIVDVLRDSLGAAAALAAVSWTTSRSIPAALVCSVSVLLVMTPMAVCLAAYANRDLRYPVIWQFSSPLDMYFTGEGGEGLARIKEPARWQRGPEEEWALYIPLRSAGTPGAGLTEVYPDWTGRSRLLVDVTNPMPSPVQLTLRIEDREHNQEYTDRFNADYVIAAGTRQRISIALRQIESSPRGRRMDMRHVAKLVLFRSAGSGSGFVLLNRMWLE